MILHLSHSLELISSYKVREPPLQPSSHHRKRSTQSDTALLPSNVYFQRTLSPVLVPSKTSSRTGRRRGSKVRSVHLLFSAAQHHLVVSVTSSHSLLIGGFTTFVLGGGDEQDSRSRYRDGPKHEEDHRQNGQETVSWSGQSSALQEAARLTATRGQETPDVVTSRAQKS